MKYSQKNAGAMNSEMIISIIRSETWYKLTVFCQISG